jgi:acyl dehydratase
MSRRCLEDFAVGQIFRAGPLPIQAERIKTFAAEFDPQPFHLDEYAARDTIFGGLVASGWHTAALTMRLRVQSDLNPAGGIVGAGFEEFRWARPVRPGTSCASRPRSSKCGRRDRGPIRVSSRCERRH